MAEVSPRLQPLAAALYDQGISSRPETFVWRGGKSWCVADLNRGAPLAALMVLYRVCVAGSLFGGDGLSVACGG